MLVCLYRQKGSRNKINAHLKLTFIYLTFFCTAKPKANLSSYLAFKFDPLPYKRPHPVPSEHTRTFTITHFKRKPKAVSATRTRSNIPDQQGCVCSKCESMSSAAVQDGVPGDLQRQLGLEVLIGQTVGALRPPIAEQPLSEEVRQS